MTRSARAARAVAVAAIVAAVRIVAVSAQRDGVPSLEIVSPAPDAYVSGATELRAAVTPAGAATSVAFFADGRVVCTVARPPYICNWNAGPSVTEHQIRVVASLAAGGRVVRTLRTRGVSYAESVDVNAVQVTVTVTDHGHFLRGLPQSVFHLFEDGQPQPIAHFASEDVPLELVVAVDISQSMTPAMPTLKEAVKEFLRAVPAKDQVTLIAFNNNLFTLASRQTEPAERVKAVDDLTAWGGTSLYDVLIEGVGTLGRQVGRKAIIVFTDGEDQGSHAPLEEVERRLQASDVTLYMIGQGRGAELANLKSVMERLVTPTGGRALFTEKIDELHAAFTELLNELSNQYLLSYTPSHPPSDAAMHRIKVEVDGRGDVRARQAYRPSTPH